MKTSTQTKGESILVTNYNLYCKNYLNVFTPLKESYNRFNSLARAIVDFQSSFTSFILISSGLSYTHVHSSLSPFFISKRFTSAEGTDVIVVFDPWSLIFVKKFISFMEVFLCFLSYKSNILIKDLSNIKININKNIYILVKI